MFYPLVQQMPVIIAGNTEQKKKYLGRMTEEPLTCVSYDRRLSYISWRDNFLILSCLNTSLIHHSRYAWL